MCVCDTFAYAIFVCEYVDSKELINIMFQVTTAHRPSCQTHTSEAFETNYQCKFPDGIFLFTHSHSPNTVQQTINNSTRNKLTYICCKIGCARAHRATIVMLEKVTRHGTIALPYNEINFTVRYNISYARGTANTKQLEKITITSSERKQTQ